MALYFLDARPVEAPLPPSAVLREPQLGRAKPPSRQELISSAVVGDLQTVGIGEGHPAQLRVAADAKDTPDLLAAWRLGARKTTPRRPPPLSKSRSPSRGTRTGRAKPPSRQELISSAVVAPIQTVGIGEGHPAQLRVAAIVGDTPDLLAAWREKNNAAPTTAPLEEPIAVSRLRTGRAKPPSRQDLNECAIVGDIQTVGIGSGRPPHLRVPAIVGSPPDLLAALRLGATQTTPPPPPTSRRADRRHTRTGRAEPQSRRALTSSAIVGDIQPVGAGRPAPRHGERRRHPRPLCGSAPLREKNSAAPPPTSRRAEPRRPPPKIRAPASPHPNFFRLPLLRRLVA